MTTATEDRTEAERRAELRAFMEDHGWSLRTLGDALELDRRTLMRYRSGESRIPLTVIKALPTVLAEREAAVA